jgi:hypothetical protein
MDVEIPPLKLEQVDKDADNKKTISVSVGGSRATAKRRVDTIAQFLVVKKKKRDLVRMAMAHHYGHPNLLETRFRRRVLTKKALEKYELPSEPGYHFFESSAYFVSKQAPADPESSNVTEYAYSDIKYRGGDVVLLAGVDAMMGYFIREVATFMREKFAVDGKKQSGHSIKCNIIQAMLENRNEPFLNFAKGFLAIWKKEVPSENDKVKVSTKVLDANGEVVKDQDGKPAKKIVLRDVQRLLPRPIRWMDSDGLLSTLDRDLIKCILEKRTRVRRERGQKLYESWGLTPSARPKEKKEEKEKKKKNQKSEEVTAMAELKKIQVGGEVVKAAKVTDFFFNVTSQHMMDNTYVKKLLGTVAAATGLITAVSEEANHFVNDLFNEIMFILCNISTRLMAAGDTVSFKPQFAVDALACFVDAVYGDAVSGFRNQVLRGAATMKSRWEAKKEKEGVRRKEKAGSKVGKDGADANADADADADAIPVVVEDAPIPVVVAAESEPALDSVKEDVIYDEDEVEDDSGIGGK